MKFVTGVVLLISFLAAAQQSKQVEPNAFSHPAPKVAREPATHLDISNASVRAYRIDLEPHGVTTVRTGHDYVLLAVSGGKAEIGGTANAYPLNLQAGEAEVFKGGWPQELRNTSDTKSTWVVVELMRGVRPERALCGLNGSTCSAVKFGKSDAGEYDESTLFETPTMRLSRAELGPNSELSTHTDQMDHVIVPIASVGYQLNGQAVADASPKWVRGSAELHSGADRAKFLIVEVKR